jgi:hypothetical protein
MSLSRWIEVPQDTKKEGRAISPGLLRFMHVRNGLDDHSTAHEAYYPEFPFQCPFCSS